MRMILRKLSTRRRSLGSTPRSTGRRLDIRKVETSLALAPGTALQWNNQSNALKMAKPASATVQSTSLNSKPRLIRKTCLTPLLPSVKLLTMLSSKLTQSTAISSVSQSSSEIWLQVSRSNASARTRCQESHNSVPKTEKIAFVHPEIKFSMEQMLLLRTRMQHLMKWLIFLTLTVSLQ